MLRHWFRGGLAAECKDDDSPVTRADREAEEALHRVLADAHPDHAILGEEGGMRGPAGARYRWVLDPLDGTRAFITGRPSFGTLIALMDDGVPILGIIDQPVTGERWIGCAGQLTRFSGPLGGTVAPRRDRALGECELSATTPAMFDDGEMARFMRLARRCGRVSYGGDCYAYGLLALGQIDVVVEAGLKPWDWAALVPVVAGAGGSLTGWDGAPLDIGTMESRVLALANPGLLHQVVDALRAAEERPA